MRVLIRYFFRGVRILLAPVMLISEKLSTPSAVERSPEEQARVDAECQKLALYQFRTCPFCIKVRKEMARLGLNIELRDAQLDPDHKQALLEGGENEGGELPLPRQVELFEKSLISQALARHQGRVSEVCDALDVPRKTLYDKLKKHGLKAEDYRQNAEP